MQPLLQRLISSLALLSLLAANQASAQHLPMPDKGRLLATAGVTQLEGAGGGGLTPWATITGYGSEDSYGVNAHITQVATQDYRLQTTGVALGIADKLEFSLAKQKFTGNLAPLDQLELQQDIVGIKLKIAGDLVTDQDSWQPQVAIGAMYKRNHSVKGLEALGITNVKQLGAVDDSGVDYYLSATKLLLEHSLLVNGTLRLSKANQMGLLGFGGDKRKGYQLLPEVSLGYLINRKLVAGVEYRSKPQNLAVDNEKAYYDAFLAWFPSKSVSLTLAYAHLGDITVFNPKNQRGWYLSLQIGQ
ncbi:DUF3034 family protein [Undibacterium sp.]|jgi:hypothetical protein|uniref:DUF3034 family protein n=1 Tax=Undibacterium sp. TaxID=1914977 RepID=UPI0027321F40|nr:DUF3034 family protein [Undibacterium sp.]MDP1980180.1 DUF3034 family protein [Undibacterium sp.]